MQSADSEPKQVELDRTSQEFRAVKEKVECDSHGSLGVTKVGPRKLVNANPRFGEQPASMSMRLYYCNAGVFSPIRFTE